SAAGTLAQPVSVIPSASTMLVIVEAVPMVMQWPALRDRQLSISQNSSSLMRPARNSSQKCHTSDPEPISRFLHIPFSIGPPVTMMEGTSALIAPISWAGVVLSQPHSNTTPSIGLARMDSSTSIAIKLRNIIVVGRMKGSPREIVGNSNGKPPAAQTPRFTASATWRRWALQFVSSLHELQMPITGLPWNTLVLKPSVRIQDRCTNPSLSVLPNQSALRSFTPLFMSCLPLEQEKWISGLQSVRAG